MRNSLKLSWLFIVLLTLCQCTPNKDKGSSTKGASSDATIRVGVFKGHGGAATCVREAYAACLIDPEIEVSYVTSNDMAAGALKDLDAFIIPGGGGSTQYLDMGASNREALRTWVNDGGTVFGICAGAYMLSDTPDYACMKMIGAKAIDIEHDNRGHGISKVTLDAEGRKIFPELAKRDTLYLMYYEGPVFVPADSTKAARYTTLATMMSDVHLKSNAPSNMTNNRPFFTHTKQGSGHVLSSVGHPEATPGMQWMIPRLLRWAMGRELISYEGVIKPNLFNAEILATAEVEKREKEIYKELLYGTPQVKIAGINYLDSVGSWDGKNWVRGLLYEDNFEVQLAAARYMSKAGYTSFLRDLEEATRLKPEGEEKAKLQAHCDTLSLFLQGKEF